MSLRLPSDLPLTPFTADECGSARAVRVRLDRSTCGGLTLGYTLEHEGRLAVPQARVPGPADGLWTDTCCEIFLSAAGEAAYREFNFSPSGQWAMYDFVAYRQRKTEDVAGFVDTPPTIALEQQPNRLQLHATLPSASLPPCGPGRVLMLGLCVVTRSATDQSLQYWALRHPAERPDFHDRRGFALAFAPTLPDC